MQKSISFEVIGDHQMACDGCEQRVERALKGQPGVQKVRANARNQRVEVLFDDTTLSADTIAERIGKVGYQARVVNPTSSTA